VRRYEKGIPFLWNKNLNSLLIPPGFPFIIIALLQRSQPDPQWNVGRFFKLHFLFTKKSIFTGGKIRRNLGIDFSLIINSERTVKNEGVIRGI
jgi:hypothetical protein